VVERSSDSRGEPYIEGHMDKEKKDQVSEPKKDSPEPQKDSREPVQEAKTDEPKSPEVPLIPDRNFLFQDHVDFEGNPVVNRVFIPKEKLVKINNLKYEGYFWVVDLGSEAKNVKGLGNQKKTRMKRLTTYEFHVIHSRLERRRVHEQRTDRGEFEDTAKFQIG